MAIEDRKQDRAFLRSNSNPPACALQVGSQIIPVGSIMDISHAGTGLRLGQPLREGLRVRLRLGETNEALVIRGRVAWCRESQSNHAGDPAALRDSTAYRGGICFDGADVQKSAALCALLEAHLETVDACC